MSSKPAGNAALGAVRKTWDKEAFEKRARERVERELEEEREAAKAKAPPRVVVQRAPLDREKARADQNLNISGEVGKKTVRARSPMRARAHARVPPLILVGGARCSPRAGAGDQHKAAGARQVTLLLYCVQL